MEINKSVQLAQTKLKSSFLKRVMTIALISGISYGLYSAFLTLGMGKGIWIDWYSDGSGFSAFTSIFILATLGAGINDLFSAIWALTNAGVKGKLGDFVKTLPTKPGLILMGAALIGGPLAGVSYVVALQMAGPIVIPIAALNTAVGALLGRILFKQELNARMALGIVICILASFLIGFTSLTGEVKEGMLLGIIMAVVAAFGWGLEGCVGGFGTSMIDYEIAITIRQLTSAITNLLIIIPIMGVIEGMGPAKTFSLAASALTDPSVVFFVVSGFFTLYAFSLWYKGNSMCGAALGMACNGTYSFWGPFFCWILLGIIAGLDGYAIPTIAWIAAVLMAFGILVIAVNPLDYIRKEK